MRTHERNTLEWRTGCPGDGAAATSSLQDEIHVVPGHTKASLRAATAHFQQQLPAGTEQRLVAVVSSFCQIHV